MEKLVRTYYVSEYDTLDVWFGDQEKEAESEEVGDGVIAKLDEQGKIIGIELISATRTKREELSNLPPDIRGILSDAMKKLAAAASRITET